MPKAAKEGTHSEPVPGPAPIPDGKAFISYASQDTNIAHALCDALERAGIPCWLASRDVSPGDVYADAIVRAITNARLLILILSQAAIDSPHVLREIERASSEKRRIITFRTGTAALPPRLEYLLSGSQWLDASRGHANRQFPKLIEAIRSRGVAASSSMFLSTQSNRNRNAVSIALFVLIAVALAYIAADKLWFSKRGSAQLLVQSPTSAAPTPAAGAPALASPAHSVAVLPFVDMSEQKDQEYLSDGMSEELIDMLTKIPDLRVPARTSSFYFKGKPTTIADIAKALSVSYVLEGSVRKSGKTLRVTAQLIRADNGYPVWSETFDRQLDDVFRVQDDIVGAVVKALKISLTGGAVRESTGTRDIEAYNLYLQATSIYMHASERAENERAVDYLHRALNADSLFANAWALLSGMLVYETELVVIEGDVPADQVKEEARRAAKQALKLNSRLPEAHLAVADILMTYDLDVPGARAQVQQALELNPNNSTALAWAGKQATMKGQFDNAIEFLQKSIAVDPVNGLQYYNLSWTLYLAGRYPEALAANRRALDLNPGGREDYYFQAALVSLAKGDPATALVEIESGEKLREHCGCIVLAYDALGRKIEADAALASLEKNHADNFAYPIGRVYANRGELDQAFRWFDRAYRQRESTLAWIKVDPLLKNVQADPRFDVFLRKMNLLD